MDEIISRLYLESQLTELYTNYNRALDDINLDEWPGFFTEQAEYRVTTTENIEQDYPLNLMSCFGISMIRDRAISLKKAVFKRDRVQRRIMSGLIFNETSGSDSMILEASTSFLLIESLEDDPSSLLVCGRSFDTIQRVNGQFLFQKRVCITDTRTLPDSLVFPL